MIVILLCLHVARCSYNILFVINLRLIYRSHSIIQTWMDGWIDHHQWSIAREGGLGWGHCIQSQCYNLNYAYISDYSVPP